MLSQSVKTKLRKLNQKKFREEQGEFIVEGLKGVSEGLRFGHLNLLIIEERENDKSETRELVAIAEKMKVPVVFETEKNLKAIYQAVTFSGYLAVAKVAGHSLAEISENEPVIVLDRINDPGNLGTIIRTADWFGVKNIILSEDSVDPYNEKAVRSSMGSIFRVKVILSTNIVQDVELLKNKRRIIALTMNKKDIHTLVPNNNDVYLFGSESHGIRPELSALASEFYTISGVAGAESLNVAISVGITLHNISKKI